MRIDECLKVKIEDVDFDKNTIALPKQNTKTDVARTVLFSQECAILLKEQWIPYIPTYRAEAGARRCSKTLKRPHQDGLLFPMGASNFRHALNTATSFLNKKGQREYHVHSTRKSFRTILGKIDPDAAEYLMGHSAAYQRRKWEECVESYRKAEPLFSLTETTAMVEDIKDEKIQNMERELANQKEMIEILIKKMRQQFEPEPIIPLNKF